MTKRAQTIKIILFSVSIVVIMKIGDFVSGKDILNKYTFQIIGFFSIQSILFCWILDPVTNYKINTKKYFSVSAIRFISSIILFTVILKKKILDPNHAIIAIIITYLLFTSFEVYLLLIKLHHSE